MTDGAHLDLEVERPVAGGAMLARHDGRVVLVTGAIPGERVRVRIDRQRRDVVHATVTEVLEADADRRAVSGDPTCGGHAYQHIAYPRQLRIKAEVVRDALTRIAKHAPAPTVRVTPSSERGYRMRARLRMGPSGLGFLRERTHSVCDPVQTGQLRTETTEVVAQLGRQLRGLMTRDRYEVVHVDLTENLAGDERVFHLHGRRSPRRLASVLREWARSVECSGVTATDERHPRLQLIHGLPTVADPVSALGGAPVSAPLVRHAASFFQANRFVVPELVHAVRRRVESGPVWDLYAGVGLFAVSVSPSDTGSVTAVEQEPVAATDLTTNAATARQPITVAVCSVEHYLAHRERPLSGTVIVDPPRTGLSRVVTERLPALGAPRVVYVSCDVATFARDVKRLSETGYVLSDVEALDMFPNTAHVELVATLQRR